MKIAALEQLMMSFMYTINSKEPRIDPWGTPHFIFKCDELLPSMDTYRDLLIR